MCRRLFPAGEVTLRLVNVVLLVTVLRWILWQVARRVACFFGERHGGSHSHNNLQPRFVLGLWDFDVLQASDYIETGTIARIANHESVGCETPLSQPSPPLAPPPSPNEVPTKE